jgi:hypothetical protein
LRRDICLGGDDELKYEESKHHRSVCWAGTMGTKKRDWRCHSSPPYKKKRDSVYNTNNNSYTSTTYVNEGHKLWLRSG